MKKSVLWSLRLGFSSAQAKSIEASGFTNFLNNSFNVPVDTKLPACLQDVPKTIKAYRELRKTIKSFSADEKKAYNLRQRQAAIELQKWWLDKMMHSNYPLIENMICFWHNHFVSTQQKVKVNYWIYQHHMILRRYAFGNFKTLTKEIIKSNAMISYLDNEKNRDNAFNENLSRELLELFTLGIGNYTEDDIKSGAKALAGLSHGDESGIYRRFFENNDPITYLGKTGVFKLDDMIDIIFDQPAIPYLVTKKLIQWFIEDDPEEEIIKTLGNYFKEVNFEIQPLLVKMFTETYDHDIEGKKIKDPLRYILQLKNELNIAIEKPEHILFFLKQQGMELFNQPNVKGWDGGNSWLSSQTYLQRNNVADLLCTGKMLRGKKTQSKTRPEINLYTSSMNNKEIIKSLTDRLVFQVSNDMQTDMETLLKYDFDASSPNANAAVLRVFNYIVKTPEFQVI
ncbi:hypothetical protein GCM10007962_01210 [Yeosuana aromativorans]|uniref:DUF1800 domain-containing protein n=1 Tax=Yeosuana aromativorans TaxID=288019 RepID=A0A8J3FD08_9FLAO|nr:DUF1800 domain-containing protein [Yeosuana aromativorans]GGK10888.1 hypothetical protein GCM10007962_01210 [Yeosuana aromativorans]